MDLILKNRIYTWIHQLYSVVPECFCEMLDLNTLHMTLHDLSNSCHKEDIEREMQENEQKLIAIFCNQKRFYQSIKMKSNFVINLVNTSLVLCLCPVDSNEYEKLMHWYVLVNEVKTLPYLYTPHITLAYYQYSGFHYDSARKLSQLVNQWNKIQWEFPLKTNLLQYQRFQSMNSYDTVFHLING